MDNKLYTAREEFVGMRLDKVLVALDRSITRQYLQKLIENEDILVNGKKAKPNYKVKISDTIAVNFPQQKALKLKPYDFPLEIAYEDDDLLVINKPAGLVVHPGVGDTHMEDSLVNALLHYCGNDFAGIGGVLRPGIVHRLDKDTSGLMVVAKNDFAQQALMKQFKDRTVTKKYLTLVIGWIDQNEGLIDAAILRDVKNRKKMMVSAHLNAKDAKTDFRVLERFDHPKFGKFTYCEVNLLTGRTHQIRVHFTAIGFPLIGDVLYGRDKVNKIFEQEFGLTRQFLQAAELSFEQPRSEKKLHLKCGLPQDLEKVLEGLRA